MNINHSKTEITVFRKGEPLRTYEKWTYMGERVNVTSNYKYMGLIFSSTLSWNKAREKLATQAQKSINAIKTFGRNFGKFDLVEYFKLFDSMVKPILIYGAEIWGTEIADEIEQIQLNFCKDFLGLRNTTVNNCMVLGECGRLPLSVDYHIKAIKYWCKLLIMQENRYPRNSYLMLKRLDDIGRRNWLTAINIYYLDLDLGMRGYIKK